MVQGKKNPFALCCSLLFVAGSAVMPTAAQAGFLGKITKAIIYPVRKIGTNASVDTHRVLQKNSVEKGQHVIVKPDGHKVPAN